MEWWELRWDEGKRREEREKVKSSNRNVWVRKTSEWIRWMNEQNWMDGCWDKSAHNYSENTLN